MYCLLPKRCTAFEPSMELLTMSALRHFACEWVCCAHTAPVWWRRQLLHHLQDLIRRCVRLPIACLQQSKQALSGLEACTPALTAKSHRCAAGSCNDNAASVGCRTLRMKPGVSTMVRLGQYAYLHKHNMHRGLLAVSVSVCSSRHTQGLQCHCRVWHPTVDAGLHRLLLVTYSARMTIGLLDTAALPNCRRCSLVRFMMASATAVSGMMGGPYSSLSSSCSLHRGSGAVGSCTICTIRGRLVPISTSRTLKRNCKGGQWAPTACQCQHHWASASAGALLPATHAQERLH